MGIGREIPERVKWEGRIVGELAFLISLDLSVRLVGVGSEQAEVRCQLYPEFPVRSLLEEDAMGGYLHKERIYARSGQVLNVPGHGMIRIFVEKFNGA